MTRDLPPSLPKTGIAMLTKRSPAVTGRMRQLRGCRGFCRHTGECFLAEEIDSLQKMSKIPRGRWWRSSAA